MRVVYYALGGGHGHVLRGLAILRQLGGGTLIGPARLASWAAACGVEYVAVTEPLATFDPEWIATLGDVLVVDVFPRGVIAELAPALGRVPTWLVSRRVSPSYYLHAPVRAALESRYECVLWTEDPPPELSMLRVPQVRVSPVVLAPPELPRDEARRRLGVEPEARLILGLGSGEPEQQARLCRLLEKVAQRVDARVVFVSAELPDEPPVARVFPAAAMLAAADVVVAAGGYHAFHETRAAGVPAVFVPQRRRHDDQAWRVRGETIARDPLELENAVRRLLGARRRVRQDLGDGAGHVAALLQRRVQARVLREEQVTAMA